MGQRRPDLGEGIRIFAFGNYVVIYRTLDDGLDVLRVLRGHRDDPALSRRTSWDRWGVGRDTSPTIASPTTLCETANLERGGTGVPPYQTGALPYRARRSREGRH